MRALGTLALCGALWGALPAMAAPADGDEISRSRGKRDGVVVLYPRVVPTPEAPDPQLDALVAEVQSRLEALAERVVGDPGRVDVRPAPERVCPRVGCRAAAVGVMIAHHDGGCAAIGIVGPPDQSERTIVPWAGSIQTTTPKVPFRQAPEQRVVVSEFVPCSDLASRLEGGPLEAALQAAMVAP